VPANDTALELLEKSQVPIAAPSANIFSHISPTSPIHVFNDFYDQMVHIIDGESC
jgi:L-threonylcarbamoyladenylate synthase